MSVRRREVATFSLSFLDLLCCGLGAMLLLFILTEQRQKDENRKRAESSQQAEKAVAGQRDNTGTEAIESFAGWVQAAAAGTQSISLPSQPGSSVVGQIGLLGKAKRLVVLVDVSGSMSRYLPEEPAFTERPGALRADGPKWQATIGVVSDLLARASGFESFRIQPLSDNLPERPTTRGIYPQDDTWADPSAESITRAVAAMNAIRPGGGANHHDALAVALSGAWSMRGQAAPQAADTIVVITDGLPNHGPVLANSAADVRVNPKLDAGVAGSEWVSAASRRERADKVTAMLGQAIAARPSAGEPLRIHVVVMPWPDDPTLVQFALRMAAPTGGSVVVMPEPQAP